MLTMLNNVKLDQKYRSVCFDLFLKWETVCWCFCVQHMKTTCFCVVTSRQLCALLLSAFLSARITPMWCGSCYCSPPAVFSLAAWAPSRVYCNSGWNAAETRVSEEVQTPAKNWNHLTGQQVFMKFVCLETSISRFVLQVILFIAPCWRQKATLFFIFMIYILFFYFASVCLFYSFSKISPKSVDRL